MLKQAKMKYIISVISLLLVTALVVIAPYGYSYINDHIREVRSYNDGTFSYSAGKSALTYDEVYILLAKSSPVWINENLGTVKAEVYKEIYTALNSFYTAIKEDKNLNDIVGFALSDNNMSVSYCTSSKVSGVVDDEPMTVNLMIVSLYGEENYIEFMYNRENLKIYEYNYYKDNSYEYDGNTVDDEFGLGSETENFAEKQFAEYLETERKNLNESASYDGNSFSFFAFGEPYYYNSISYDNSQAINEKYNPYQ